MTSRAVKQGLQQRGREKAVALNELLKIDLLRGRLLEDVTLAADGETTEVAHRLGRQYKGWFVVGRNLSGLEYGHHSENLFTWSSGGFAHGLGGVPSRVLVRLEATVSDVGYGAGSFVDLGLNASDAANYGVVVNPNWQGAPTSPDEYCWARRGSSGIRIINTSGNHQTITTSRWTVHFYPERPRTIDEVEGTDGARVLLLQGNGFTGNDKVDLWVF